MLTLQLLRHILKPATSQKALTNGKIGDAAGTRIFDVQALTGRAAEKAAPRTQTAHRAKDGRYPVKEISPISLKVKADIYKAVLFKPSISKHINLLRPLDVFLNSLQKTLFQKHRAEKFQLKDSPAVGADLNSPYRPIEMKSIHKNDNSPLMNAIVSGNREQASKLIASDYERIRNYDGSYQSGRDINTANRDGLTPLHIAVEKSDHEILNKLLTVPQKNFNIPVIHEEMHFAKIFSIPTEQRDARGFTPMQIALQKDDHSMVDLLMKKNIKPIPYSAKNNDLEIVANYLQRAGESAKQNGKVASAETVERLEKIITKSISRVEESVRHSKFFSTGKKAESLQSTNFIQEITKAMEANPDIRKKVTSMVKDSHAAKSTLSKMGMDMKLFESKESTFNHRPFIEPDPMDLTRVFTRSRDSGASSPWRERYSSSSNVTQASQVWSPPTVRGR